MCHSNNKWWGLVDLSELKFSPFQMAVNSLNVSLANFTLPCIIAT